MKQMTTFLLLLTVVVPATAWLSNSVAAQSLNVVQTDNQITVRHDGKVVLTYNKVSPPAPSGICKTTSWKRSERHGQWQGEHKQPSELIIPPLHLDQKDRQGQL